MVTFLASLELSRLKKMRLHQEITYSPIFLELLESLKEFDLDLAASFEYQKSTGAGPQSILESAQPL